METHKSTVTTAALAAALALTAPGGTASAAAPHWDVNLWPGGRIAYRFADANDRDGAGIAPSR